MSIFSLFKKKDLFTQAENDRIVSAIKHCETSTSGEIRVYIENKNPLVDTLERAAVIFNELKMYETAERNAVLLYLAVQHKEVAVFGDTGIHTAVGDAYWQQQVLLMLEHFRKGDLVTGIEQCILDVGQCLMEKFPYRKDLDKNELPDEIVFGK